jgi:hypothetical protein
VIKLCERKLKWSGVVPMFHSTLSLVQLYGSLRNQPDGKPEAGSTAWPGLTRSPGHWTIIEKRGALRLYKTSSSKSAEN